MITYFSYKDRNRSPRQVRTEEAPIMPVGLEIDMPDMPGQRVLAIAVQVASTGQVVQYVTVGSAAGARVLM